MKGLDKLADVGKLRAAQMFFNYGDDVLDVISGVIKYIDTGDPWSALLQGGFGVFSLSGAGLYGIVRKMKGLNGDSWKQVLEILDPDELKKIFNNVEGIDSTELKWLLNGIDDPEILNQIYTAIKRGGTIDLPDDLLKLLKNNDGIEDIIKRIGQIEIEFNLNKNDLDELRRQLDGQQDGLNKLTIKDYLDNKAKFDINGRDLSVNADMQKLREKALEEKVEELYRAGNGEISRELAEQQAEAWLKTQAVLHDPDQIVGGFANRFTGLGDKNVNSSIGSQWRWGRADSLDEQIQEFIKGIPEEEWGSTYLDIILSIKEK